MAPGLGSLSNETLFLILGQFCLHCSKARNYDAPHGHFRHPQPQHGEEDQKDQQDQDPDKPAWYSRDYRKTLHSMCLVSRRFRHAAQSVLYHEFMPGYGDSWRSTKCSWDGRLASFVRTLAARPDLAALVKRVYIHPYLRRAATEEEAQGLIDDILGPAGSSKYLAHFEAEKRPRRKTSKLRVAAVEMLGMLLVLVPNVERLGFQTESSHTHGILEGIPEGALSTLAGLLKSRPFAKLSSLDICDRYQYSSLGCEARPILEVAAGAGSLTTLNLHMCEGIYLRQAKLESISTLRITHSCVSKDGLASLMDSLVAPTLQSFVYEATSPRVYNITASECLFYGKFKVFSFFRLGSMAEWYFYFIE
jgi:hypothetical protein